MKSKIANHYFLKTCQKYLMTGFTLIEILVVMLIISIITSVAMLSIHINHKKQLETLAYGLSSLITLAEEEALLRPATLGLSLSSHHYQFYSYDNDSKSWKPLTNRVFDARSIPSKIQVTLKINDTIMPADGKPRLIISQNGDASAFTIYVGEKDKAPLYRVEGKENGEIYVK